MMHLCPIQRLALQIAPAILEPVHRVNFLNLTELGSTLCVCLFCESSAIRTKTKRGPVPSRLAVWWWMVRCAGCSLAGGFFGFQKSMLIFLASVQPSLLLHLHYVKRLRRAAALDRPDCRRGLDPGSL
ncbi:UNVERIFIED_CONTAM: hypothetical protein K2H54_009180 [Gekko kuhli]